MAGTTLAGAIEIALEESDERRFWAAVTAEHAALTAPEREEYARAGGTDDLSDADDKAISERNEW